MDIAFKTRKLAKIVNSEKELHKKRKGQHAVDLVHPYRLILQPNHDPLPRGKDGSLDTEQVTAITIIEVTDYH